MALTVEALDRNSRREARHRFSMSSIMLASMVVLSFVAVSASKDTPTVAPAPADTRSARLAEQNARQAREINALRNMFMFCREHVNWGDESCSVPAAEQFILTRRDAGSDSDNGSDSDSSDSDSEPSSVPASREGQRPGSTGTVSDIESGGGRSDRDSNGNGGGNHGNDRGSSGKGDPK